MFALRGRAVLLFSLLVGMFAFAGPAFAADATMTAADDAFKAAPTGVRDVLANDSSSSSTFTIVSNTQPAHGSATCSALGACFYKAASGFTGVDTFTYTARSSDGAEGTATVTVTAGNSTFAPALIARDDDVATPLNTAKQFNALANDTGDGITMVSNGDPKHGTVTCQGDGTCNYTPNQGYSGSDGFVYTIQESGGQALRHNRANIAAGRQASAAVHILVAPAGTGYKLTVGGSPVNPSNGAIPPGGKANWALNVLSIPDGVSGQELAAFPAPEGSASLGGPHALTAGSLKTAKGWSGTVGGDGKINYKAGSGALLGSSYTQTFPKPLPPISQGTGGDGHVPILVGSKVFAFYHHSHPTSVTCVDRATGSACPGYPKFLNFADIGNEQFNGFGTTDINGPAAVVGSKIFTHLLASNNYAQSAPLGLFCWDEATDSTCGYTIVARFAQSNDPVGSAPVVAGGKVWFAGPDSKLYCVDPDTGNTCGSLTTGLAEGGFQSFGFYFDIVTHGSRVYVSRRNDKVACLDVVAGAPCAGWETPKSFDGRANLITEHDSSGAATGICVVTAGVGECVSDADPGTRREIDNFVQVADYYEVTEEAEIGTRTLVGSLNRGGLGCYDWVTRAPCTGGAYGSDGWISQDDHGNGLPSAYGAVSDGACAIALGDPGQVFTVDPAGTSPCTSLGSGTDRTTLDLRDQRCDGTIGSAAWRNVALSDTDGNEMESVVVTVRDARTGEVLKSGEMIGGDQTLDLSSVNTAQHPSITIDATAKSKSGNEAWSDGIPPRIRVNWKSDPQTTCLQTTGDGACGPSAATVTVAGALANGSGSEANLSLLRNACAGGVKGEQAKSCGGKRLFNIHLRFKGKDARKITVTVRGKKQKLVRMNPRPVFRVDLRKYARQRIVVKITIVTKKGKTLKGTRVYHPCTKKKPGRGFRF